MAKNHSYNFWVPSDERRSFATGLLVDECQSWGFATTAAELINSAGLSFSRGFT
jgi:hypothetical protein